MIKTTKRKVNKCWWCRNKAYLEKIQKRLSKEERVDDCDRDKMHSRVRKTLAEDPWYATCAVKTDFCEGQIEWHHVITYGGKLHNAAWSIVPLCRKHHAKAGQKRLKATLLRMCLQKATDKQLYRLSKVTNYLAMKYDK